MTHHVQQRHHEASPGSTGSQPGRTSCEGTAAPALPQGKDLLYRESQRGKVRERDSEVSGSAGENRTELMVKYIFN